MLKKTFAFMLAIILLVSFTACGKKVEDSIPGAQEYHGEGEIQGGIKSDEELAKITEEADTWDGQEDEESTNEHSFEDNTGHEPESYNSGNFQDYWKSDNYFDLIGYLTAHGFKGFNAYDSNYEHIKDEMQPVSVYGCYSKDFIWRIDIGYDYMVVCYIGGDPTNPAKSPSYDVYPKSNENEIKIDERGSVSSSNTIELLASIVQNIESDSSNMDPMRNTDAIYNPQ